MKRNLLITVFAILAATNIASAQFNPKRRDYSDDEKRLLFEGAIKEEAFKDDMFDTRDVPEKWKNESIVILGRKVRYVGNVNPWTNIGHFHYYFRIRFKLQDKDAVENFSEYYFDENEYLEITIEKADGSREVVDLSKAIEVEENVSGFLFSKGINVSKYMKLAIPKLEVGDIVDVVSFNGERFNRNWMHYSDPLFLWTPFPYLKGLGWLYNSWDYNGTYEEAQLLNEEFPMVTQKIEFDLGRNFYLNWRSLNGASDLEEKESKFRKSRLWIFTDNMRDKAKYEEWTTPMFNQPAIKYEIHWVRHYNKRKSDRLIDFKNKLKTHTNDDDIRGIAYDLNVSSDETIFGSSYYTFIKSKEAKDIEDDDHETFFASFYNHYRSTTLYSTGTNEEEPVYDAALNNRYFIRYFLALARNRKVPYTLIMGVPRSLGGIDALLSREEVIWGIKLDFGGKEVIYTDCDLYAQPGEINPMFEGLKLYEIKPALSKSKYQISDYQIQASKPEVNQFYYKITADFQPDLDTVKITRKTRLSGMARYRYKWMTFPYDKYYEIAKKEYKIDHLFVTSFVYDYDLLEDEDFLDEESERLTKSLLSNIRKDAVEKAKRNVNSSFALVSYDSLSIIENGLDKKKPEIIIEEQYTLRDVMDDIGNNTFVLKVGSLIEDQIEIQDQEDRERNADIVYPYSRQFLFDIEIKIPFGMTVSGVEQLNRNVDNETGSFISIATVEGQLLKVKIEKTYKGNVHKKEQWSKILQFIDEAVDYRSAKVILKRTQ